MVDFDKLAKEAREKREASKNQSQGTGLLKSGTLGSFMLCHGVAPGTLAIQAAQAATNLGILSAVKYVLHPNGYDPIQTIILLPGVGQSADNFVQATEAQMLAQLTRCRVVVCQAGFDHWQAGTPPLLNTDFHFLERTVQQYHCITPAGTPLTPWFYGHSDGSTMAVATICRHPELVGGLILSAPTVPLLTNHTPNLAPHPNHTPVLMFRNIDDQLVKDTDFQAVRTLLLSCNCPDLQAFDCPAMTPKPEWVVGLGSDWACNQKHHFINLDTAMPRIIDYIQNV